MSGLDAAIPSGKDGVDVCALQTYAGLRCDKPIEQDSCLVTDLPCLERQ